MGGFLRGDCNLKAYFRTNRIGSFVAAVVVAVVVTTGGAVAGDLKPDTERAFGKNAGITVKGIRFGLHPDKFRLVLDATGPLNFDYWMSESGKTIVVLIPQIKWSAPDYIRMGQDSRIYRVSFFANPSGGGVLSILGRSKLGLSAIEQIGPDEGRPYRVVFDIPNREQDAWLPIGGIMRDGKLLPSHEKWPPAQQAVAGTDLPVVTRQTAADGKPPVITRQPMERRAPVSAAQLVENPPLSLATKH